MLHRGVTKTDNESELKKRKLCLQPRQHHELPQEALHLNRQTDLGGTLDLSKYTAPKPREPQSNRRNTAPKQQEEPQAEEQEEEHHEQQAAPAVEEHVDEVVPHPVTMAEQVTQAINSLTPDARYVGSCH